MPQGQLFVVAAPSGAGKTSLVNALIEHNDRIQVSVSYTTRQIRAGEADGIHYHFVNRPSFLALQAKGGFLESAQVFGHLYGTSLGAVEKGLAEGKHLVLEIDWQGAAQIRTRMPASRSIFILPPSRETLLNRLQERGDNTDTIASRMAEARSEMSHYHEFDYLIVNDDFDIARQQMEDIILNGNNQYLLAQQLPSLSPLLQELIS